MLVKRRTALFVCPSSYLMEEVKMHGDEAINGLGYRSRS
jgi:hypothetical protein